MTPERWIKVEELFHSALGRSPDERQAFLDQACGAKTRNCRDVELLLTKGAQAGSFREVSPFEVRPEADGRVRPMRQAVEACLKTTAVLDWQDPAVSAAARRLRGTDGDPASISRRCFEFVRAEIEHTQDHRLSVVTLRASEVLAASSGFSAMWLRVESAVRLSSSADE